MLHMNVIAEDESSILSQVFIHFHEDKQLWKLKGRFMGYVSDKGYIEIPVKGKIEKFFHGYTIGEVATKYFPAISKKEMRIIWKYVVNFEEFVLVI